MDTRSGVTRPHIVSALLGAAVALSGLGATTLTAQSATMKMLSYGTSADESFTTLTAVQGGFVTGGYQDDNRGFWRTFLAKYDNKGSRLWMKDTSIEPYATVEFGSQIVVADDMFQVVGFDQAGKKLWTFRTESPTTKTSCVPETLDSFVAGSDGFLALLGCAGDDSPGPAVVAKYDSKGAVLWERFVPRNLFDTARVLYAAPDGSYLIGGSADNGNVPTCPVACSYMSPSNPVLAKFDASGTLEWSYVDDRSAPVFAGIGFDFTGITPVGAGGYFALMRREETDSESSAVMKFDDHGQLVWASTGACVGSEVYHPATQIVERDGGAITIGGNQSSLCAWNPTGALDWEVTYKGVAFQGVVADRRGGLLAVGQATKGATDVPANRGGLDAVIGHFDAGGHLSPWPGLLWPTPSPTVNDTPPVTDQVLTADPGVWGPSGVTLKYQWYRRSPSGTVRAISGAVTGTYQARASDLGQRLRVKVTGVLAGFPSVSKYSAWTSPSARATFTAAPTPAVSGVARVGMLLAVATGTWDPSGNFKYQWFRVSTTGANTAIAGATKASYTPTSSDLGRSLKVRVKGYRSGYSTTTRYSQATTAVLPGMVGATPKLSDTTPHVDQELTASEGNWTPVDVTFTYQWYAKSPSGKVYTISGATAKTYSVDAKYVGYKLKARVTGSKSEYAPASKTSAYTYAVAKATFTTRPVPTISGTPQVGGLSE